MDCAKFRQMLDNYENLSDEEKLSLAEHTVVCEECKKEYDFFLSVIASVKNLPELTAPDDFVEKVRVRIDSERKKEKVIVMLRKNWYKYSSVAACLLIAAMIGANSNMLVSRMQPGEDNGVVVSERRTFEDRETRGDDLPVAAPLKDEDSNKTSEEETKEKASAQKQGQEKEAQKQTAAPRITSVPASAYENIVSAARPDTANNTAANNTNNTSAEAPSYTRTPVSEPEPAPRTPVREAEQPEAVQTDAPTAATAVPDTGSGGNTESYALERNRYRIPSAYSDSGVNSSVNSSDEMSGYSISDSDGEIALSAAGTPKAVSGGTHIGGSIYVDIQYADEFMSVMNSYITGSEGEYYLINSGSLNAMFSELSALGVNYGDFIESSATGEIAFNVVFF